MARRIIIINEHAPTLDTRSGITKVLVRALRVGDVTSANGEQVVSVRRATDSADRFEVVLAKNGIRRHMHWHEATLVGVSARANDAEWHAGNMTGMTKSQAQYILKTLPKPRNDHEKMVYEKLKAIAEGKNKDGVGTPEEIAYGEGWHSKKNDNPYESPEERAAWEKGRKAVQQRGRLTSGYFKGEVRGRRFEAPRARQVDNRPLPARLAQLVAQNRDKIQEAFVEVDEGRASYWVHLRQGWICGAMETGTIHEDTVADVLKKWQSVHKVGSRDYKSEKGYVAKILNVATGGELARSEPYISNGVALKAWIQGKAGELIRQGKRVKAEVVVVFFDPLKV